MQLRIRIKERDHDEEIIEPGPYQVSQMEDKYGIAGPHGNTALAYLVYRTIGPAHFAPAKFKLWFRRLEILEVVPADQEALKIECDGCGAWLVRSVQQIARDTVRYDEEHGFVDDDDDDDGEDRDPKD